MLITGLSSLSVTLTPSLSITPSVSIILSHQAFCHLFKLSLMAGIWFSTVLLKQVCKRPTIWIPLVWKSMVRNGFPEIRYG